MNVTKKTLNEVPQGKWQVIGISDWQECQCCGKKNLKRTIHLEHIESGEDYLFGVDCSARALHGRYRGKRYQLSRDAMLNKARIASQPKERQRLAGYYDAVQFQMEAS